MHDGGLLAKVLYGKESTLGKARANTTQQPKSNPKLESIEKRLEAKVQRGKKVSFDNDGGHFFVHHSLDEKQCAQLEKDCLEKDKSDRLEHQPSDDDNPDNDSNGDEEMLNINDPGYFVSRAQDYSFSPVKAPDQVLLLTHF